MKQDPIKLFDILPHCFVMLSTTHWSNLQILKLVDQLVQVNYKEKQSAQRPLCFFCKVL